MPETHNGTVLKKMTYNGQKVKKWKHNGVLVYSAGEIVTYYVNGVVYKEEVEDGESVLSPTSFTPSVSGATFLGWSESKSSTSVLTSKVMNGEPITLYGVYTYTNKSVSVNNGIYFTNEYPERSHTFISGIDSSKYYAISVYIDASLRNYYESTYYNSEMYIDACGSAYHILTSGNNEDTNYYKETRTFTLGSGSTLVGYITQDNGAPGDGYLSLSNAVLLGRTLVG